MAEPFSSKSRGADVRADSSLPSESEELSPNDAGRGYDLLALGDKHLSRLEKAQIRFIRRTFEVHSLDRAIRILQRTIGANWIEVCVRQLRRVYGIENVPTLRPEQSVIVVSNHRSFFDLYVIAAYLVKRGLTQRLLFPVRSTFFYDSPLGFFVNGVMSFFAMYPPVFRERSRASLNVAMLDETAAMLRRGGVFVGLHPEGQRNKSDDPYALLPAQRGVGRIIRDSGAIVLPVFINGLINDLPKQVRTNFDRTGKPVIVMFGKPIDFGPLLTEPSSPRVHKRIAERALAEVLALGEKEREVRRTMT
jgi:1-acyl-sn-glycerol-3-phosphate acyltransferase